MADPAVQGLADTPADERHAVLLDLVQRETAELIEVEPATIAAHRPYSDYGYNSMAAVELTNRLSQATGRKLPLTLLFDHPTPAAVATHLLDLLLPSGAARDAAVEPAADAPGPADAGDPVVVVGTGCRFPGGVASAEDLWDVVASGRDVVGAFPSDRGWDLDGLFDDDPDRPGTSYARTGGFVDGATEFDAEFFGVGRVEATAMDPQQRVLLETVWEALENAGIDPGALRRSATGVYMGSSGRDYEQLARAAAGELEGYWGIGSSASVLSGRVAYAYGFEGPAVTVDTACSSSLVSVHLAVRALRGGECDLAVAGGVTIMATPQVFTEFSRQRALSPDGRCRAYARSADGTGFSEGVGVVLLERLSDARRNGHRVLAVVRGTAINQDGTTNGLTAPNGPSQERVIAAALADAGLRPADIDAIEGHGTGTTLGDPIEIDALHAVFAPGRPAGRPLRLGSLKSNIGHAQAAAGVGGLIKLVGALGHATLPATRHVDAPTDKADWPGPVALLTEAVPWPHTERPRRAGVSAFGMSGTNAHAILEEPPAPEPAPAASAAGGPVGVALPFVVSGRSGAAVREQARRLRAYAGARDGGADGGLYATAAALAHGRTRHPHRAAVIAADSGELLDGLARLAAGETADDGAGVVAGTAPDEAPRVAFVFPGQGSQWPGMGAGLAEAFPAYARTIDACADALRPYVDWSLWDVLRGAPGAPGLERADVAQPALFAVMVALADLWRTYGVEPGAVVGHSQGEIAAAYVAGALSLDDAARVVALRSRALSALRGKGGMVSVTAPPGDVLPLLERFGDAVAVAAVNGPSSLVVSGDAGALDELLAACAARDIWARRVKVDYASHGPHVEAIRAELADVLAPIAPRAGGVRFCSTVTAAEFDTAALDADYWFRNLRSPVRFADTVRGLLERGFTRFIEVSPHPILTVAIEQTIEETGRAARATGTLHRDAGGDAATGADGAGGGARAFVTALAGADVSGIPVVWDALLAPEAARRAVLPTYAFQRTRLWAAPAAATGDLAATGLRPTGHPLLPAALARADGGHLFTGRVAHDTHPWLADHAVYGTPLLPGTAFVEMALAAGAAVGADTVEELVIEEALAVPSGTGADLQAEVGEPDAGGRRPVTIHARPASGADADGAWTRHADGFLTAGPDAPPAPAAPWPPPDAEPVDVDALYDALAARGMEYGTAFQGVAAAWRSGTTVYAEVDLDGGDDAGGGAPDGFTIHPALLDAAFHAAFTGPLGRGPAEGAGDAWLPVAWSGVRVQRPGARRLRATLRPVDDGTGDGADGAGDGARSVTLVAVDDAGAPTATVGAVVARPVPAARLAAVRTAADALYRLDWTPAPVAAESPRLAAPGADAGELPAVRPDAEVVRVPDVSGPCAGRGHRLAGWALETVQRRLAAAADVPLAIVTRGAVATADEPVDPAQAAVWGLVRAAQAEHPGRFVLADLPAPAPGDSDGPGDPAGDPAVAVAVGAGEEQVAVRGGGAFVPRLARGRAGDAMAFDPDGTVLITGGTGGLGAALARHLAVRGARHLVLASRSGARAAGAAELRGELAALGAEVTVAACDTGDADAVRRLVAGVDAGHPLTAVVHAAGVLDDGLVADLDADRLARVLRPKVDAAWHLHEATADRDLRAFVLFSSVAGVIGGPGQANYAAGNAFLDALAAYRRHLGLPAVSLAWGLWARDSAMTRDADTARLAGSGVTALSDDDGLRLFDTAHGGGPVQVPVRLDPATLRARARDGDLPPVLRGLAPVSRTAAGADAAALAARLAAAPADGRDAVVLEAVTAAVAGVLGRDPAQVDAARAFSDLGLDSLGALRLRNRLQRATGLTLPTTLVFGYPSAEALAGRIRTLLEERTGPADAPGPDAAAELDRLAELLATAPRDQAAPLAGRLRDILAAWEDGDADGRDVRERIGEASADEIFRLIDDEMGIR